MQRQNSTLKKFSLVSIIVLALTLIYSITTLTTTKAFASSKPTLLILGDSIAYGHNMKDNEKYGYLVAKKLDYELVNKAVSGHKTTDLISLLKNNDDVKNAVKEANYINISIGGNDLQGDSNLPTILNNYFAGNKTSLEDLVNKMATNFAEIIDLINNLNKNVVITVLNSYVPIYFVNGDNASILSSAITGNMLHAVAEETMTMYNQTYSDYIKNNQIKKADPFVLVDVRTPMGKIVEYYIKEDQTHPSAEGNRVIADALYTSILEYNYNQLDKDYDKASSNGVFIPLTIIFAALSAAGITISIILYKKSKKQNNV